MNVEVLSDKQAVAERAAELVCGAAEVFLSDMSELDCQQKHAMNEECIRFRLALSGGSTPKLLYQLLTRDPWKSRLPWNRIDWYFGDERFVPSDDAESNYRMVKENLFDSAGVSLERQFRVRTELETSQAAAEDYEESLLDCPECDEMQPPKFDLMLLGMGADGHTASLFPHTEALHEEERWVVANRVEKLDAWRITMTPPVLLAAERRIVLVTGEEKAAALAQVLEGSLDMEKYPAQLLRDTRYTYWLVDKAAAGGLRNAGK